MIEAVLATARMAELLWGKEGSVVLFRRHTVFNAGGDQFTLALGVRRQG